MENDQYTISSDFLDVGDGHKIWYMVWGNPKAVTPTFHLHGGPGGGTSESSKNSYDPNKQLVIFHDQRGSGKSQPFGELKKNTTTDLVGDIQNLAKHLGFQKFNLVGGSWGSTLALVTAIRHPEMIEKMVLWSIYLGTKAENDRITEGALIESYPEAWEQFDKHTLKDINNNTHFLEKMQSKDLEERDKYIRSWLILEGSTLDLDSDYAKIVSRSSKVDEITAMMAIMEAYYFENKNFLPDNYIIENADKLGQIKITLIHGRHDKLCTPIGAYNLARRIGDSCYLQIIPAAHQTSESTMREVLKAHVHYL